MSVLRSIESKIEGLFEGVFGRAFRAHVQPVELARKLAKEMDEHRSVSVSRVYVPNEYTIYLSTQDRRQFSSYEGSLVGELQEYLVEHGRREGYALLSPPRVLITTDEDLAIGEFGIAARVATPDADVPALPGAIPAATPPVAAPPARPAPVSVPGHPVSLAAPVPDATMIYRTPPASEGEPPAEPEREVVTLTMNGRALPVTTRRVVLGRSRECDVRVTDGNVSRLHAEVVQEGATYWVADLESTNGTELNGQAVTRARLSDGDRITIGATDIVFGRTVP